ncbi:hypothetical protein Rumeso_02268 [Rubellimicrobium mesophilum DSM 19309]|uniref:Bacteriophage tail tape measure N-terminal domain-containing protein n=1 Tax=Rubellimicrobium mesophilum DSM 19309 TaxID=442562 RepID=A0A017HNU2_9RHOB|nr:hypothetical protein [Rubellimicrobium mesophilum]EYD76152.1 hypothetical protein Rumeso_02268 [Rubellimicrobium mesophilum DSM 19309]
MAGTIIGSLRVALGLDSAEFAAGAANAEAATTRLGGALSRLDRPVANTGRAVSSLGPKFQNASFQLQDMIVQLQGGQKASLVLAQQLPQLAGGFGAFGAALGLAAGLSIPFLARMVDTRSVLDAAGQSLGNLVGILPSFGSATGGINSILETVAGNLDRIAIYGATAAALFAGRYVAGLAAAAVATGSLSGALLVLRGALVRTGFGAIVVGAGELAYQFTRLVDGAGGFGNALSLLSDVASEVWGRIGDGMGYLAAQAAYVAAQVQASFLDAFLNIGIGFVAMTQSIAAGLNKVIPFADPIRGLSNSILGTSNMSGGSSGLAGLASDATDQMERLRAAATGLGDDLTAPLESLGALRDAMNSAGGSAIDLSGALGGGGAGGAGGSGRHGRGGGGGVAGAAKVAREAVEAAAQAITRAMPAATEQALAFNAALQDAAMTASEVGEKKAQILIDGIDGVADAFGDWISSGFRDFKGFVSSVLGSFKSMLAQMISLAARNRIMLSMGITGAGVAGPAVGMAQGAGIPVPGGAAAGAMGGLGGFLGNIGTGFGNVVSGLFSGGLGGAGTAISEAMAGATSGLAGLGTAIGAIAGPAALAIGLFSAIKGKTELLDSGLRVTLDGFNALVETFDTVKKTRFFGLSSSTSTSYGPAGKDIANPIKDAYAQIGDSILDMAKVLGKGRKDFRDFSYDFQLSLKDMTAEEQVQAVTEKFGEVSDKLAVMAGATARFSAEGETATQTLERMVASFGVVRDATRDLWGENLKAGEAATKLATRMVEAAGGRDAFRMAVEVFRTGFFSLEEQANTAQRVFARGLQELGVTARIESEADFRAVVASLRERGMKVKASGLMALADEFKTLLDLRDRAAQEAADNLAKSAPPSNPQSALHDQYTALLGQIYEAEGKIGEARKLELAAMPESLRWMKERLFALEDEAAAQAKAQAVAEEAARKAEALADARQGMLREYYEVTGNVIKLRKMERDETDPLLRSLYDKIEAAKAEKAVADERADLDRQILEARGDTVALLKLERDALDPLNRKKFDALQIAKEQAAIEDEREGLMRRLYEATDNQAALDALELKGTLGANQALLLHVRAMEKQKDAAEEARAAIDALVPEDFATRFDFLQAKGRASAALYGGVTGTTATGVPLATVPVPSVPASTATTIATLEAELKKLTKVVEAFQTEQRQIGLKVERNTNKSAQYLDEAVTVGMPTYALKETRR